MFCAVTTGASAHLAGTAKQAWLGGRLNHTGQTLGFEPPTASSDGNLMNGKIVPWSGQKTRKVMQQSSRKRGQNRKF